MTAEEEVQQLRKEVRDLRKRVPSLTNAHRKQKERADTLADSVHTLKEKVASLEEEKKKLTDEIAVLKAQTHTYRGMIFKTAVQSKAVSGRTRGAQVGHLGHHRAEPVVTHESRVYLSHCVHCDRTLDRSQATDERLVEDIVPPSITITRYTIERQWCTKCHQEVRAVPQGVVPKFSFGTSIITLVLFQKYRLRLPLNKIRESLREQYRFSLCEGTVQNILHSARHWFGADYDRILKKIQRSPLKHADETGHRILGMNGWCWLFATPKAALYTIEETRGKGVPEKILGSSPRGVLVRDDYGGYKKLPMAQQSCWAHLLRLLHESMEREASSDLRSIHTELNQMFTELKAFTEQPFALKVRVQAFEKYRAQIGNLCGREYTARDAKAIQTRVRNQRDNLITALLHDGVPLTNNHAERQIRPLAVMRKISGGSRSRAGASTLAVNMSIVQTLVLQGKSVMAGLTRLIERQAGGKYALVVGE